MTEEFLCKLKSRILIFAVLFSINFTAIAQKATKLLDQGKEDKAIEYCKKCKGEKQKICNGEIADYYYLKGKLDKATEYYVISDKADEGLNNMGDYYLSFNSYENAMNTFSKTSNPEIGYKKVGDKYIDTKTYKHLFDDNFQYAIDVYKLIKDNKELIINVVNLAMDNKCPKQADYGLQILELTNDEIKTFAVQFFSKGHFSYAKDYYLKANLTNDEYYELGIIFYENGRNTDAVELYQKKLDKHTAYLKIAEDGLKDKKAELAYNYFKHIYAENPAKLEESNLKIAALYEELKEEEKTNNVYLEIIKNNPNINRKVYFKVIDYYVQNNDFELAYEYAKKSKDESKIKEYGSAIANKYLEEKNYLSAYDIYISLKEMDKANDCLYYHYDYSIRDAIFDALESQSINGKKRNLNRLGAILADMEVKYTARTVKSIVSKISSKLTKEANYYASTMKDAKSSMARSMTNEIIASKRKGANMLSKIVVNYTKFQTTQSLDFLI